GLNDTTIANFSFSYVGTGATTYGPSASAPSEVGTYSVTATWPGDANHTGSSGAATAFSITNASSSIVVVDSGGAYNGLPYPATSATATDTNGLVDTNLTNFSFSYSGTGPTVYGPSATAPTDVGTYTVTASWVGDANHPANNSAATPFAITQAISLTEV